MAVPNARFVTIDEVVAEAASIIDGARREDRNLFKQWIYRGQRRLHFGMGEIVTETVNVTVVDLTITKPTNLVKTIDIALIGSDGTTEYVYKYQGGGLRIHENVDRFSNNGSFVQHRVDLSETDNYWHLGTENSEDITTARIRYYGLPVDENDNLAIPEDNIYALMSWVKYMWARRDNLNTSEVMREKEIFEREAARVNAMKKMPTAIEQKEIARTFNSMIPTVRFDTF